MTTLKIPVSDRLAAELPADPTVQSELLKLGLQAWRIREALAAYGQGKGSLAYAAERAGVSLREIIPLAYAHGLTPKVDPELLDTPLALEQAALL